MSALVCGKRSYSRFEEHLSPSSVTSKRCCRLLSSLDSSPPRVSAPDSRRNAVLSHLLELFPDMEKTIIQRVFDEYGNDIDAAIKKLKELHIEVAEGSLADGKPMKGIDATAQPRLNDVVDCKIGEASFPFQINDAPSDGSGWLDLFVAEMSQASSIDDFRGRASRVLGILEQNITARFVSESGKNLQKENTVLKEQVESLQQDNNILKRAVAIQHERQRQYNDKIQEFEQLKQLVSQYQERVRSLEINNYALSMHLKQAQNNSSIPGRFHPDVF